jgi:hypothetical protein
MRRVRSISIYCSAGDFARQAVVGSSSSQPRVIGQTVYEAAQALAQFSIQKYTASGTWKNTFFQEGKRTARKLLIQAACGVVRTTCCRQGPGISSEIETFKDHDCSPFVLWVARGLASHLRLKRYALAHSVPHLVGRQGPGISSEIETLYQYIRPYISPTSPGAWHLI